MNNSIEAADASTLRERLSTAIELGHIWPAFQPIVNMRTGGVAGFEILARWNDPQEGDIGPASFIPYLERHGLISLLSDKFMDRACRDSASWPGRFTLAFNISPFQLTSRDLPRHLADLVALTGFPLERIELEVTEGSLISDRDLGLTILQEMNTLGMKIGIDDFGTGYSRLARLEAFPFHKLKIDARFVRNLNQEASKRRIEAAVIGLGQSLGITVVAEGVETEVEAEILRKLGCDQAQGWLYGKGVPFDQARQVLEARGTDIAPEPLDASPFQRLHQLASLYDQSPVGLCFVDPHYRHVRVNDQFAKIHGLRATELEGKTVYEVMQGDVLEDVLGVLTEAAATNGPVTREYLLQGRNVLVLNSRVQDLAGEIIGFSVVAIDITEERDLREALATSERRLRRELDFVEAVLRSLPGIFYYYNAEMQLKRWNANHTTVSGYSDAELQDVSLLGLVTEGDREKINQGIEKALRQGRSQTEAGLVTKDGERIPYLFTGVRFDHDDRAGLVGTGMDISESKRLECALRENAAVLEAMIESSPDGLLLIGPDGNRIVQNRRFNEIWKIPPEHAKGPQDKPQFQHVVSQVKKPAEFVARVEWLESHRDEVGDELIHRKDGTIVKRHTMPLYDCEGRYRGRIWACRELE